MEETIFEGKDLALIRGISKVANAYGYSIFLVGGIVRDLLMDKTPKDIDLGKSFWLSFERRYYAQGFYCQFNSYIN